MRQQINLYQPIFRRERKQLSAVTVALGLAVIAVALTAFSVYTSLGVNRLQRQVQQLSEQQAQQHQHGRGQGNEPGHSRTPPGHGAQLLDG